jgi:uncharacterized phage protein (TIGR02216 family)
MVNRHRGEIEATLDGKSYRLCLTLGALAELEHAFGEDDMLAVAERFEAGRIAAREAIRMIGAGLRGAGYEIDDDAVASMRVEGGAAGFVDIVARLLAATFAAARGEGADPFAAEGDRVAAEPFPWAVAMEAGLGTLRLPPSVFWANAARIGGGAARCVRRCARATVHVAHRPDDADGRLPGQGAERWKPMTGCSSASAPISGRCAMPYAKRRA